MIAFRLPKMLSSKSRKKCSFESIVGACLIDLSNSLCLDIHNIVDCILLSTDLETVNKVLK